MTMRNLFLVRSTALRLTVWYLLIIMFLSLLFSSVLYQASTKEFNRELKRASDLERAAIFMPRGFDQFRELRIKQIEESKHHIRNNLVLFNLIILALGGTASYFLAQKTLSPIEEALESQHRFTADASHELRTPLTAMRSEIEVALRDKKLTLEEAKALLKSNLEEVGRLEALSAGLLTLAQADHREAHIHQASVDLKVIAEEVLHKISPLARSKSIVLESNVESVSVEGDKKDLSELITILLDNAIKYSASGTTVTVAVKGEGKQAKLSVQDTGIGISKSDLPYIFDRFYRADISRTKHELTGYGLGLSIAKKIVEQHKGSIEVTSIPHKGSTFMVSFPSA